MVAKAAGVSPSTVSRILNGTATVSPEKREAIDEAIRTLGFRPEPGRARPGRRPHAERGRADADHQQPVLRRGAARHRGSPRGRRLHPDLRQRPLARGRGAQGDGGADVAPRRRADRAGGAHVQRVAAGLRAAGADGGGRARAAHRPHLLDRLRQPHRRPARHAAPDRVRPPPHRVHRRRPAAQGRARSRGRLPRRAGARGHRVRPGAGARRATSPRPAA